MNETKNKYSPEVGESAAFTVMDNARQSDGRKSAMLRVSSKIGYAPNKPNDRVKTRSEKAGLKLLNCLNRSSSVRAVSTQRKNLGA